MKTIARKTPLLKRVCDSFKPLTVKDAASCVSSRWRRGLTDVQRRAIMLHAEGNVYLSTGCVVTAADADDMRRKALSHVF